MVGIVLDQQHKQVVEEEALQFHPVRASALPVLIILDA